MTPEPVKFEFDQRPYTVHVSVGMNVAIQKFHQRNRCSPTTINVRWYGTWDPIKGRLIRCNAPQEVQRKVEGLLQDFYGHQARANPEAKESSHKGGGAQN